MIKRTLFMIVLTALSAIGVFAQNSTHTAHTNTPAVNKTRPRVVTEPVNETQSPSQTAKGIAAVLGLENPSSQDVLSNTDRNTSNTAINNYPNGQVTNSQQRVEKKNTSKTIGRIIRASSEVDDEANNQLGINRTSNKIRRITRIFHR